MKKVVVFSTLVVVCLSVVPVHASGQGRADGCRTFNIWAHEPPMDETDYLSCGIVELEQGRKVKHTDTMPTESPVIVTESPVAPPVVVFTPEPPIECENEDDDDDNDGDECEGDGVDDDDIHEP